MNLTDEQVEMIQKTFKLLNLDDDLTAVMFYDRLFSIAPTLQTLFERDLALRRRETMRALLVIVNGVSHLNALTHELHANGHYDIAGGVRRTDFIPVGAALIWTLRAVLGDRFTPAVEAAWAAFYGALILATRGEEETGSGHLPSVAARA